MPLSRKTLLIRKKQLLGQTVSKEIFPSRNSRMSFNRAEAEVKIEKT